MNKLSVYAILLFSLQMFFCFSGVAVFGIYFNPILFFVSFLLLFFVYNKGISTSSLQLNALSSVLNKHYLFVFSAFAFLLALAIIDFNRMFTRVGNPGEVSDVIPQLEIMFDRFRHAEFPYKQIDLAHSKPFPVYMPLHWLPLSLTQFFQIDSRWSGIILLALAMLVLMIVFSILSKKIALNVLSVAVLFSVLFAYILFGNDDLALSVETTIAAFYLIVATGLILRNVRLTTIGIIACLLSRYTLVFWLPLFCLFLYQQYGFKKLKVFVASLLIAVLLIYVLPFLTHDSSIFLTGLKYHNDAAKFEWEHGSYSFGLGIYFAPHIDYLTHGNYHFKVSVARAVQAIVMMLILVIGYQYYKKNSNRINSFDFLMGMFYLIIACFYLFSPLTYRYYMISPLMLSSLLVVRLLLGKQNNAQ